MIHRADIVKIVVYEAFCEDCDWSLTFSAGDPDAGTLRAARANAYEAIRKHRSAKRQRFPGVRA